MLLHISNIRLILQCSLPMLGSIPGSTQFMNIRMANTIDKSSIGRWIPDFFESYRARKQRYLYIGSLAGTARLLALLYI